MGWDTLTRPRGSGGVGDRPEIESTRRARPDRASSRDHLYFTLRPCQWHAAKVNSREVSGPP